MGVKFGNNASTLLTNNITAGATSFDVDDAAIFPAAGGADYLYLTLSELNNIEIIKVTDITGNTLTCVRAQEGTSAFAFSAGDACDLRITTLMLLDALAEAALSSAEQTKFDGIEDGAEVTSTAKVNSAGAAMESDFNANTLLAANADNTPLPLTIAEQRLVGRITGGNIIGLTAAQIRTFLNIAAGTTTIEDGAEVNKVWTYSGSIDLTSGSPTSVALLSGLPAGVQTIEIHFQNISTNTDNQTYLLQIGDSGGLETSGYVGMAVYSAASASASQTFSSGFMCTEPTDADSADTQHFFISITNHGSNLWVFESKGCHPTGNTVSITSGRKTLSGILDRLTLTTPGGSATFDGSSTAVVRYK